MPLPLRRRVAIALTVLGLLLCGLFAGVTLWVVEDYEYVLATEMLRGQAEDYGLQVANGVPTHLPRTHRLSGYLRKDVPRRYAGYPLGVHEDPDDERVHVGVFDVGPERLFFTIDLTDIEALESHLDWGLAAMVVLGTLLSGTLGWVFAGAALKPLARFAQAVDTLPDEPTVTTLREDASADELGRLAGAIDDYQRRLVDAEARAQAFLADASHELRTPIAVVQGATEVMLDDADGERDPRRLERLRRLDRGVREMTDLVEMLLLVARKRPLQVEAVDVARFLQEALSAWPASQAVEVVASGELRLPRREALLLLRHAIDGLGWPASAQRLRLVGDATGIELSVDAVDGMSASAGPTQRSDRGGPGALAQRLAHHIGWRVERVAPGRVVLAPAASTRGPRA